MPSKVQSVLIPRDSFTQSEAIKWLKMNGYNPSYKNKGVDITQHYYRYRQMDPNEVCRYRTQKLPNGVLLVLCWI